MDVMKELYEKVAKDDKLQAKFNEITKNAENERAEELMKKLQSFAKEEGYEVTPEEIQAFFKDLAAKQSDPLSDAELDMVAGGKTLGGQGNIAMSVVSIGVGCVYSSVMAYFQSLDGGGKGCSALFQ